MLLETERLVLTELTIDDAPFFYELVNDPDWIRFIGDRNVSSLQDAENYLVERILPSYTKFGFGFYKVSLKGLTTPIGISGLINREVLDHVDIGFAFLPSRRGKGYAFESTKAILKYAQHELKLDPILAIVNPDNKKSQLLLEKLGLHYTKMILLPGETKEICLFST
ncbi:MAG: GNAT family N-acetyltransferase [Flavobacteriaceae bacterium]|nr:GNAT family N-acetyltransferase [Flavobacteriaceae bacterium]